MSTHEQFEAEIEKIKNLPEEEKRKLDERAHNGEVVVPGGTGGKSLEAQIHLAEGRHKGGHHRAHELGHEGYKEMGKKGGASSAEQSGQEAAQGDIEAEIERIKKLPEAEKKKLDERARNGEVVVPGGTGGKSLEAQLHLAEGRHKGGVHRAQELGHEGYSEMGKKAHQTAEQ